MNSIPENISINISVAVSNLNGFHVDLNVCVWFVVKGFWLQVYVGFFYGLFDKWCHQKGADKPFVRTFVKMNLFLKRVCKFLFVGCQRKWQVDSWSREQKDILFHKGANMQISFKKNILKYPKIKVFSLNFV